MKLPVHILTLLLLTCLYVIEHNPASAVADILQSHGCEREEYETNGCHFIAKREAGFPQDGSGSFVDNNNGRTVNVTDNLESALQNLTSHTIVHFEPGNYTLEQFVLVRDVTNITLEADGDEEGVSIQCIGEAGLAFINVSYLSIRNITVDGCGFTGSDINSTVDILGDIVNIFYVIPRVVRIAVLIGHCENMTIESVTIKNTRGFGLVGINVIGNSLLSDVVFFNNTKTGVCRSILTANLSAFVDYDNRYQLGGAAAFMYFDYHDQARYQGNKFSLDIQNCYFTHNAECSFVYINSLRYPGQGESRFVNNIGYRIGGSASFALGLAQLQYGIDISMTSSIFHNNSGYFGNGLLITLFGGVQNTHVVVDDCLFNESTVAFFNDARLPQNIEYPLLQSERDVTLSFTNSNFINNNLNTLNASNALFVDSNNYFPQNDISKVVKMYIDKCLFTGNRAFVGTAILIYEYKINGFNIGIQISIKDTDFISNEIVTFDQDATITISQSAGIVDIKNVNLTLQGNCSFINNTGTALRAQSSLVGVDGNITFLRNIGINGGALHLVSYAYLIMNRNSSVYFIENEARIGGGAIYVNENGIDFYLSGGYQDCFIHFTYNNFFICEDCSDLNSFGVYIQFSHNVAPYSGSMVYGSALRTCPWASSFIQRDDFNRSVFEILYDEYPNVFDFDQRPDKQTLVRSSAAKLSISVPLNDSETNAIEVFPGEVFNVSILAIDDFNNTLSGVVAAFAQSDTSSENGTSLIIPLLSSNSFAILTGEGNTTVPVRLFGRENQNVSVVIYSTDIGGRAQEQINVRLYSCGFGFIFDSNRRMCACDPEIEQTGLDISCNLDNQEIIVPDGIWVGPFDDEGDVVVHRCLFRYCKPGQRSIKVVSPDDITDVDFNVQCDDSMNRVGFLCGSCAEGYSAVLGTRRCRKCSNWYILLYPIFIVIGIVAIFALRYLNITITAGFINGAIFYSNIVSIYGTTLVPGGTTINGAITLVSFPTLNLGFETCLHDKMNTLEKVWWQLSFPFYLFILMGITTLLARTKYLKFNRSAGLGTIQAFATLLILCYVSVLEACIELIGFRTIVTTSGSSHVQWISDPSIRYFGKEHGTLGFIAYLIMFLYIIPLPFFLLFPSALYRSKYLGKFKPIYDAFWDPFKPQYRFFLGFRLIFRWIPFALALSVRPPINLFITNILITLLLALQVAIQPFREKWRNIVDAIFVFNLLLLLSGSIFSWSEYNSEDQDGRETVTRFALSYSSILIFLGFLLMLAIVLHHLIMRFSRLRNFIGRYFSKTPLVKIYNIQPDREASASVLSEEQQSELLTDGTSKNGSVFPPQSISFGASELREPLLESGSVNIYSVSPSSVPARIQGIQNQN